MYASDFATVLNNVMKVTKNNNLYGSEDGAWFVYDEQRDSMMCVCTNGSVMYWEELFIMTGAHDEYRAMIESNKHSIPCRVGKKDLNWVLPLVKAGGHGPVCIEKLSSGEHKTAIITFSGLPSGDMDVKADCFGGDSFMDCMYNRYILHDGKFYKEFAPMEQMGHMFILNTYDMKLCMDMLAIRKRENAYVKCVVYGSLHKDIESNRRYIRPFLLDMRVVYSDDPSVPEQRGAIATLKRPADDKEDRHYLD